MPKGTLVSKYLEPPFTVLDARSMRWQKRKKCWLQLGIQSELGRDVQTYGRISNWINRNIQAGHAPKQNQSVFDPVLCELIYRWFCPRGGVVVDPFAGGSVRGIVAALLNRKYYGVELSAEQVAENEKQAQDICGSTRPNWIVADAWDVLTELAGIEADLILSCPPYWNLERYSDDQRDLSNLSWPDFLYRYREIIRRTLSLLRPDRFACFVVANIRDKRGGYVDLVGETIRAFEDAGAQLYNEAVLLTQAGTAPVRAATLFRTRKLAKTHQNVLVFVKGNVRLAAEAVASGLETDHEIPTPKARKAELCYVHRQRTATIGLSGFASAAVRFCAADHRHQNTK